VIPQRKNQFTHQVRLSGAYVGAGREDASKAMQDRVLVTQDQRSLEHRGSRYLWRHHHMEALKTAIPKPVKKATHVKGLIYAVGHAE